MCGFYNHGCTVSIFGFKIKLGSLKRILPAMAEMMKLAAIITRPIRAWLIFC